MIDWNHPLIIGLPMAALTFYGFRLSKKKDDAALRSGIASNGRAGTDQLIDNLQEDNKVLRENSRELTKERDTLKMEVVRLMKKYGVADENGPTERKT